MKEKYYIKCPKCGNNENFITPKITFLIPAWLTLGIPSVYRRYVKMLQIQCEKCDHIFQRPSVPQASVAKLSICILAIVGISIVLSFMFAGSPGFLKFVPDFQVLEIIEEFINNNSKGVTISIIFMLVCITILCSATYFISNFVLRYRIKREYKLARSNDKETN